MSNVRFPYTPKEAKEAGIEFYSEINRHALFPTRMRKCRKQKLNSDGKPLSQEDVAKAIGVTRSTIGLYETGDNVPDIKTIARIAEVYDVTVNYLLGIDERPSYDEDFIFKKTGLSPEAVNLLVKLKDIKSSPAIYYVKDFKELVSKIITGFTPKIIEYYQMLKIAQKQKTDEDGFVDDEKLRELEKTTKYVILPNEEAISFYIMLINKEIDNILRKSEEGVENEA